MFDAKKLATYSLLLLSAGLVSIYLYKISNPKVEVTLDIPHYPDVFANTVVATVYNPDGKIAMKMITPHIDHYPNQMINFVQPDITIYEDEGAPWLVKSDYGQTKGSSNLINFWGNVQVTRAATSVNNPTQITAPALAYHTDTKLAESDQRAFFTELAGNQLWATGFRAYLDRDTVDLLANVSGTYDPKTAPKKPSKSQP